MVLLFDDSRYLLVRVPVATVVHVGVQLLIALPTHGWAPQPGFVAVLVVILLTSPLQALDSIAICGLAGGVLVALLTAHGRVPRLPAQVVTFYVMALTGWGLGGLRGTALLIALAAAGLLALRLTGRLDADRVGLWSAVVCTAVLAALGDLHGVSLASGIAAMALVRAIEARYKVRRP